MLELLTYAVLFWVVTPILFIFVGKFIVRYTVEAPGAQDLRYKRTDTRNNGLLPTAKK